MRRSALLLAIALALATTGVAQEREATGSLLRAPHHGPDGFFNPWEPFDWSLMRFLRWQFSRNPFDKSRDPTIARVTNDGSGLAGREHSATATWVGHATVAIHDDDDVFLTDPHFSERALVPRRVVPPGVPIESIPADAFAVISHNHYDHLDAGTVERLPETVAWFVPLGLAEWFRERGRKAVVELVWWQSARHGRWTITCLPSQHWSRRIEQGINESLWCAWLLDSGERRYFFAGDTGYFSGFAEYGRQFGPIDLALLPIGAYEPRWFMRYQHLNPDDAVRATRDLAARHMLGIHWGTFDLTDEPLDLPPKALAEAVTAHGESPERFRVLAVGETWHLPEPEPQAGAAFGR
jgi:N-acyl-phosphatidylethanolamine-hydrolysing phospholipase D